MSYILLNISKYERFTINLFEKRLRNQLPSKLQELVSVWSSPATSLLFASKCFFYIVEAEHEAPLSSIIWCQQQPKTTHQPAEKDSSSDSAWNLLFLSNLILHHYKGAAKSTTLSSQSRSDQVFKRLFFMSKWKNLWVKHGNCIVYLLISKSACVSKKEL